MSPWRILAVAGVLALLGGGAACAEDLRWQGSFVPEAQGSDDIAKVVEAAVAPMNFIKRPIARGRLKKTNPAYQHIDIAQTGSGISVRFDGGNAVVTPLSGTVVRWTRDDGEQFDVTGVMQGEEFVQTFRAEDGERANAFHLDGDGKLTLHVTLTSPQLPAPVKYTLVYRRTGTG